MDNEWVAIPGFDNKYVINKDGQIMYFSYNKQSRSLAIHLKKGRPSVQLTKNNSVISYYVDDLVARTFMPDEWHEFCIIEHIDGIFTNMHPSNLKCINPVPDLSNEEWLPAPGQDGHVLVSNMGRVKRVDHYRGTSDHLYSFYKDFDGYLTFAFSVKGYLTHIECIG